MNTFKTSTSRKGDKRPNETMYKVTFARNHFITHAEFDREGPCYNYSRIYKKGGWDDYHEETCTRNKVLHYIKLLKKRSEAPNATWLGRTDEFGNEDGSLSRCYYTYETYSEQRVPENSFDGTSEPAEGNTYVMFVEPIQPRPKKVAPAFPTTKEEFYAYWEAKLRSPLYCVKSGTSLWTWNADRAKVEDCAYYFRTRSFFNEEFHLAGVKRELHYEIRRNKWGYPELVYADQKNSITISGIVMSHTK